MEYPNYLKEMPDNLKGLWEDLSEMQKKFIVFYVSGGNGAQSATKAGYSRDTARQKASQLLTIVNIKQIVDWMNNYVVENALDISIMSKRERLQKLTRMIRTDHSDFITEGGDLDIQKAIESGNIEALQELTTNVIYGKEGAEDVHVKKIKLHDPVKIIAEMNKMDGSYAVEKIEVKNTSNRVMIIRESGSADDWEKKLAAQQEKLVNDSKSK